MSSGAIFKYYHRIRFWFSILLLIASTLFASQRNILYEEFTNRRGEISNQMRPSLDRAIDDLAGEVIPIRYHVFWPDNTDPLYLPIKERGRERIFYYGIKFLPDVRINGRAMMETIPAYRTYHTLRDTLSEIVRKNKIAQFDLRIYFQFTTNDQCSTQVLCRKNPGSTADNLVLHCLLLEDQVKVGSNPLEDHVVRYFITEPAGLPLNFDTADSILFLRNFNISREWQKERVKVIAFIQNSVSKEIFQAATSTPRHRLACPQPLKAVRPNETADYSLGIRNSRADSAVIFVLDEFQPVGAKIDCAINLIYPDSLDSSQRPVLRLGALASDSIKIQIQAGLQTGTGIFVVSAHPKNQPTWPFKLPISISVLNPRTVLIVDDDGFAGYETVYQDAMPDRYPYTTWEREWYPLTLDILQAGVGVIWFTGRAYPTLDQQDRLILAQYLDQGGRLLITGQDIGWELCDSSSFIFNPSGATVAFYQNYLGASYVKDSAEMQYVFTPMDQPDIDSLMMKLDDSQRFPSIISPLENASPFLAYSAKSLADTSADQIQLEFIKSPKAGVRFVKNAAKVAYVAFGLEGVTDKKSLAQLMANILNWLGIDSTATRIADHSHQRLHYSLGQNYPNPFNAKTVIEFSLASPARVRLEVFDILGRLLAVLVNENKTMGEYRIFFDAKNLASGIYFYRLQIGSYSEMKKMTLLR